MSIAQKLDSSNYEDMARVLMGSEAYLLFHFDKLIVQVSSTRLALTNLCYRLWRWFQIGRVTPIAKEIWDYSDSSKSRRISMSTCTWLSSNLRCSKYSFLFEYFVVVVELWTTSMACASGYYTARNQVYFVFISSIWALTQASEGVRQVRLKHTQALSLSTITKTRS